MTNFSLDSEVDLDRPRRFVVRREQERRLAKTCLQKGSREVRIGSLRIESISGKYLLPERLICGITSPTCTSFPQIPTGLITPVGETAVLTGTWPGCPARQALLTALNAPVRRRAGRSKRTLFQITFSKNNPTPPRITVLPFLFGSHANPNCGAKLEFGLIDLHCPYPEIRH